MSVKTQIKKNNNIGQNVNFAFLGLFLLVFLSFYRLSAQDKEDDSKPNIIVFLVDDMGWQDTSVPFWDSITSSNKKFHTPQMEKLASKSMKFTNAYANSICTPSRVSLMTGMNAAHHKVTEYTVFHDEAADPRDKKLKEPVWNRAGLSPIEGVPNTVYATPLFQLLKNHGYFTIHSGKAHFGAYMMPGADPKNLGADINIAGSSAGHPASYLGKARYGNKPGETNVNAIKGLRKYWDTPTFLTKALTLEAIRAMDSAQAQKKPFFLYMSHYAVHSPYDKDDRYFKEYRDNGLNEKEAAYAALIEGMDTSLGRILDYLDREGLKENTIIIFMSDNGGLSHPPRTKQANMDVQNYPLRYGKGSLYEGGIREPMLVYWPGVTKEKSVSQQVVSIWDFFPTILEMASIRDYQYEISQRIDGQSFVPILKSTAHNRPERVLLWHFPNSWGGSEGVPGYSWTSALRKGNWKLIYLQKEQELRLYNLKNDISEKHNLIDERPDKAEAMARLMTVKLKEGDAQMPTWRSTGKKVAWPLEVYEKVYWNK